MKAILTIFVTYFTITLLFGQTSKTKTDWIDFEKTYFKIKISEDGIYKISYKALVENNFGIVNGSKLVLINEGKEIPIYVSNDSTWNSQDYLEFYGEALDGEFDKNLFENPEHQLKDSWSQFTDTAVYFLANISPRQSIKEFTANLNSPLPPKETHFMHTSEYYAHNGHFNGVPDGIHTFSWNDNYDQPNRFNVYLAKYGEGEGWTGDVFGLNLLTASNSISIPVNTPCVFNNGSNVSIELKVVGQSNDWEKTPDHKLNIKLNSENLIDDEFEGYAVKKYTVDSLATSLLTEPTSTVNLSALNYDVKVQRNSVSYIKINYPRTFNFDGLTSLFFSIETNENGNYLEFENLEQEATYYLYDLTNNLKTQLKYNDSLKVYQTKLPQAEAALRQLYFYKFDSVKEINKLQKATFTNFADETNQGDYIIISHPQLELNGTAMTNYVNYRASDEGGNYKPVVVNIQELYDLYSFGIEKHPLAIKYFLKDVIENWGLQPKHCFIIGKGIKNSKCRFNPDSWNRNLVPVFGAYPSDQVAGSANFEPLSKIAIGRLSITKPEEIEHYLNKVKAVEQPKDKNDCNYFENEAWRHMIFHIGGGDEETFSTQYGQRLINQADIAVQGNPSANSAFLFKVPVDTIVNLCQTEFDIYPEPYECLVESVNMGNKIINFLGASNGIQWEVNLKNPDDYNYDEKYPVIFAQDEFSGDIYNSYNANNALSMSEVWVNAANSGAVAYIGPTQLFEPILNASLFDELYKQIFQLNANNTLGQQFNKAVIAFYDTLDFKTVYAANNIAFSGDPALKLYSNNKPEIAFIKDKVSVDIDQLSDVFYTITIQFAIASLNIPASELVNYKIIRSNGTVETEVSTGQLQINSLESFKSDFNLVPGETHTFKIILDNENQFDEICETNNTLTLKGGEWLVDVNNIPLSNNSINNYPNPFTLFTVFDIKIDNSNLGKEYYIEITSLDGRTVHKITLNKTKTSQQIIWDGADAAGNKLSAGIYFYYLKDVDESTNLPGKIILAN